MDFANRTTATIFEAALTIPILLAVLFGLRAWWRHRMETRAWLSGEDRRGNRDL